MSHKIFFLLIILLTGCSSIKVKPIEKLKTAKEIYEESLKLVAASEYNDAIEYFEYIVKNFDSIKDEKYISLSYYEIGFCYYRKGDDDLALKYFNIVLDTAKTRRARILAILLKNKIKRGDGYKNASYN